MSNFRLLQTILSELIETAAVISINDQFLTEPSLRVRPVRVEINIKIGFSVEVKIHVTGFTRNAGLSALPIALGRTLSLRLG